MSLTRFTATMLAETELQSITNNFNYYRDTGFRSPQSQNRASEEIDVITLGFAGSDADSPSSEALDFTQMTESPIPIPYIVRNGIQVLASSDEKRMGMHFGTGVTILRSADGTSSSLEQKSSIPDSEDDTCHEQHKQEVQVTEPTLSIAAIFQASNYFKATSWYRSADSSQYQSECPTTRPASIIPKASEEPVYARLIFDPEWSLPMRCAFEDRDRSDVIAFLEERGEICPTRQDDATEAIQQSLAEEGALYRPLLARYSYGFLDLVSETNNSVQELISREDQKEVHDLLTEIRIHSDASPFIVPFGPRRFFNNADEELAADQIDRICPHDGPYWSFGQIFTWLHSLPSRIPMVQVSGFLDSLPSYYSGTDILQNDAKLREWWPKYRTFWLEDLESSLTESSLEKRPDSHQSDCSSTGTINYVYPDQSLFTDSRVLWLNVKLEIRAPSPPTLQASNLNSSSTLQTQPQASSGLSSIQNRVMQNIKRLSWRLSWRSRHDNDSDMAASQTSTWSDTAHMSILRRLQLPR